MYMYCTPYNLSTKHTHTYTMYLHYYAKLTYMSCTHRYKMYNYTYMYIAVYTHSQHMHVHVLLWYCYVHDAFSKIIGQSSYHWILIKNTWNNYYRSIAHLLKTCNVRYMHMYMCTCTHTCTCLYDVHYLLHTRHMNVPMTCPIQRLHSHETYSLQLDKTLTDHVNTS